MKHPNKIKSETLYIFKQTQSKTGEGEREWVGDRKAQIVNTHRKLNEVLLQRKE